MLKHSSNGFYQVGSNWASTNKYYAILEAVASGQNVYWNFNDLIYDSIHWENEPVETLETLYALRAKEIRDKYNYVALAYSGGLDSHNILMTFINNNIPFDEIISFQHRPEGSYTASTTQDLTNISSERDYVIRPMLKMIAEKYPNVKISTDYSWVQQFVDDYDSGKLKSFNPGEYLESGVVASANYRFGVDKNKLFRDVYDKPNSTIVFGVDKPRIVYDSKHQAYSLEIGDNNVHLSTTSSFSGDYPSTMFYWGDTPLSAKLVCKQCHCILRSDITVNSANEVQYNQGVIYPHGVSFSVGKGAFGATFSSQNTILTGLSDMKYYKFLQYLTLAEREANKKLLAQYNNEKGNDVTAPGSMKRMFAKRRVIKRLD